MTCELSFAVLANSQSLELRASCLGSLSGRPEGQAFEFEENGLMENAPPRQRWDDIWYATRSRNFTVGRS
jgi:hypothetical protein